MGGDIGRVVGRVILYRNVGENMYLSNNRLLILLSLHSTHVLSILHISPAQSY